jgi:hypothetical protein
MNYKKSNHNIKVDISRNYLDSKSSLLKRVINVVRAINLVANSLIWISFSIFTYFVLKATQAIGHLPFYGDPELIELGYDKSYPFINLFFELGFFGFIISLFILIINKFIKGYKTTNISITLGIIGLLLQIVYMFSPQFTWYVD